MGRKVGRPVGATTKVVRDIEGAAKRCGRASLDALTEVVEDKGGHQLARVLAAQTLLELGYGASLTDRAQTDAVAAEAG